MMTMTTCDYGDNDYDDDDPALKMTTMTLVLKMMRKTDLKYDDSGVDDDTGVEDDENGWCWR